MPGNLLEYTLLSEPTRTVVAEVLEFLQIVVEHAALLEPPETVLAKGPAQSEAATYEGPVLLGRWRLRALSWGGCQHLQSLPRSPS